MILDSKAIPIFCRDAQKAGLKKMGCFLGGFYWVLLVLIGFYWVLLILALPITGFYWVLLGFFSFLNEFWDVFDFYPFELFLVLALFIIRY